MSSTLESDVAELWERYDEGLTAADAGREELDVLDAFLDALEAGEVRAAERRDGTWAANEWVKRGVLLNFGLRETVAHDYGG
ncbi:MAG: 2,3,4,5-tetrahydropyridine-2,6-dicarboxylate N-succinyltransferase, partial [Haloarculaceae archaeon]